jgi:hypothetical protein
MPHTVVVDASAWRAEAASDGDPLGACGADIVCLQPFARALGASLIVVPQVVGDRVTLLVAAASSGEAIGATTAALSQAEGELNVSASADNVVVALFTALSLEPEIDLRAAIAEAFPAAAAVAAAGADPDPAPEVVAGAERAETEGTPRPEDSTEAAPDSATGTPGPTPGRVMDPRRARSIALGLLPVPGLSSASLGDFPGFILGAAGTVGLGWAAVYAAGKLGRTDTAFWLPALLIPWGISVVLNQVAGAISWNRLHGSSATAADGSPRPRLGVLVSPRLDPERGALEGAALVVVGTF